MKLLLGIPSGRAPAAPFLESLATLKLPASAEQITRCVITGNYVPAQRDLIVERALESGVNVLIMCDDDMVLPPHAVAGLCATLEANPRAAVVGALYYSRDGFRPMVVDKWNEHDTRTAIVPAFDREPVAVDGVGFGCVALRVSALRELMPPYFAAHIFVEREAGRVRVCDEDYLLCAKLRRASWLVMLDPNVRCGHYDRRLERTMPGVWEGPEVTSQSRMAALVDGRPTLIPLRDVPDSTAEAQVQADLRYIIVP